MLANVFFKAFLYPYLFGTGQIFIFPIIKPVISFFSSSPTIHFFLSAFLQFYLYFILEYFFLILSIIKLTLFCHFITILWNKRKTRILLFLYAQTSSLWVRQYRKDVLIKKEKCEAKHFVRKHFVWKYFGIFFVAQKIDVWTSGGVSLWQDNKSWINCDAIACLLDHFQNISRFIEQNIILSPYFLQKHF